jgi:hypothetical protein
MECLLQYLDNLDDVWGALGLLWERIRGTLLGLFRFTAVLAASLGGIGLALLHAQIALATSTVLFVVLLYHKVTSPTLKSFI